MADHVGGKVQAMKTETKVGSRVTLNATAEKANGYRVLDYVGRTAEVICVVDFGDTATYRLRFDDGFEMVAVEEEFAPCAV